MTGIGSFGCFLNFSECICLIVERGSGFLILIVVTGCYIKTTLDGFYQFIVVGI